MKVLNLRCARLHSFEGWFGSEDDFQDQLKRGLMACPVCADGDILKMPSAPRLNLGGHVAADASMSTQGPAAPAGAGGGGPSSTHEDAGAIPGNGALHLPSMAAHTALLAAVRQVMAATEDVGPRFADEARRMHYGEIRARNIRGQATVREAAELHDEGIDVVLVPLLPGACDTLQ